ncbi:HD domain-containing protein [Marinifilum caeruleilacunae]|uniref:HD domain-containing protein n=1 Tax=Marinifilum caeruleilacunae TaxID=2499076 RepID=A0ABX1WX21_9BACT|nr:HD domain-containing protein [Marinifilum caeruleilacunae]NOU60678.1 HD domain-containing protein [Marinifilum caeruleilacunae]
MYQSSKYIAKVEEFVSELLCDLPDNLCYHNLKHTKEVVEACKTIAKNCKLSASDTEIVIIAAWFHDSGHAITYFGHEEAGTKIATDFLQEINYPGSKINKVVDCILATHYPPKPKNELQRILCDADMYHLSLEDYESRSFSLLKELETVTSTEIPKQYWCDKNVEFLKDHCYFTNYGKKVLQFLKEKNIKKYFTSHCKNC